MIGGDVPFYVKIWRILIHLLQNALFSLFFVKNAKIVHLLVYP